MFVFAALFLIFSNFVSAPQKQKTKLEKSSFENMAGLAHLIAEDSNFNAFLADLQALITRHDEWIATLDAEKKAEYLFEARSSNQNQRAVPVHFLTKDAFEKISIAVIQNSQIVQTRYGISAMEGKAKTELLGKVLELKKNDDRRMSLACGAMYEGYIACAFALKQGDSLVPCWSGYLTGCLVVGNCRKDF